MRPVQHPSVLRMRTESGADPHYELTARVVAVNPRKRGSSTPLASSLRSGPSGDGSSCALWGLV